MTQIQLIHKVIWGSENKFTTDGSNKVVNQWLEAHLEWSDHEPFALVQRQGGPCSVLAPLQAYIISILKDKIEKIQDETVTFSDLSNTILNSTSNAASDSASNSASTPILASNSLTSSASNNRDEILTLAVIKIFKNFKNPPQLLEEITDQGEAKLSNDDIKTWCKKTV
jgi:hypothetical protein